MNNFIKSHYIDNDTFIKEAHDLKLLEKHLDSNYIKIPQVIEVTTNKLELQRILEQKPQERFMYRLGVGLARLHQQVFKEYGYEEDNFIGLNVQKNRLSDNWGEFFFENRLQFQVSMIQTASLRLEFEEILQSKKTRLIEFLNENCEHPSLVHGDLWSGNVMFDKKNVWLIDPSSYFADREVDIAMTELFLGFEPEFYDAYNEIYPLSENYEKKKIIFNLYHNLNHFNLFGHAYLKPCHDGFDFIKTL